MRQRTEASATHSGFAANGTGRPSRQFSGHSAKSATRRQPMDDIIYLVGLVVVVMAILSFFGLR